MSCNFNVCTLILNYNNNIKITIICSIIWQFLLGNFVHNPIVAAPETNIKFEARFYDQAHHFVKTT